MKQPSPKSHQPLPLLPFIPFLFTPFPSLLLSFLLSPKIQLRGLLMAVSSPSGVRGRVPATNAFLRFLALKTHPMATFFVVYVQMTVFCYLSSEKSSQVNFPPNVFQEPSCFHLSMEWTPQSILSKLFITNISVYSSGDITFIIIMHILTTSECIYVTAMSMIKIEVMTFYTTLQCQFFLVIF